MTYFRSNRSSDSTRQHNSEEMVFGIRPVMEAIEAGRDIDKLFIQKDEAGPLMRELLQLAREHRIPVNKVPVEKLNTFTRKVHQGVVAFFSAVSYASLENVVHAAFEKGKSPVVLILDRVTDVRNFGGIARSAECMGVDAIVVPFKGAAAINGDAMKTSAGALNHIHVCREDSLVKTVQLLKNTGLTIIACTEKAKDYINEVDFTGPCCIIMGSEEDGISNELIEKADIITRVPMLGKVGSLNVGVATGMILYEMVRQRGN